MLPNPYPSRLPTALALVAACLAAAPLRAQEARPEEVQVVDVQGRPVPDVLLADAARLAAGAPFDEALLGRTDEQGRVAWPVAERVVFEAPGFLAHVDVPAATVVLVRPSTLDVVVADLQAGTPVSGATVRAWLTPPATEDDATTPPPEPEWPSAEDEDEEGEPTAAGVTGADGALRVGGLEAGTYRVRVTAPGRMDRSARVVLPLEGTGEARVRQPIATSLRGMVRDGDRPVADASVQLLTVPADRAAGRAGPRAAAGPRGGGTAALRRLGEVLTTDASGGFHLARVPAVRRQEFFFVAMAIDGRWGVAVVPPSSRSGEGGDGPLAVGIDLAQSQPIVGRVTWADGSAAVGIEVVAELARPWEGFGGRVRRTRAFDLLAAFEELGGGPVTYTGPEGEFALPEIPLGGWQVVASPPDHAQSEPVLVRLPEDSGEPLELVLPGGVTLAGVVVDEQGEPLAGAAVRLVVLPETGGARRAWLEGGLETLETTSGRDGRFRLSGVPDDARLRLSVEAEGHGRSDEDVVDPSEVIRVVLRPSGTLSGRVLSHATGQPLERFSVQRLRVREGGEVRRLRGQARGEEITSEDGTFTLDPVRAGRWAVTVRAEGYLPHTAGPVEVLPGGDVLVGDLFLKRGATVVGRVVDADTAEGVVGATVAADGLAGARAGRWRVRMQAYGGESQDPVATTTSDGRFELGSLPAGDVTLRVRHHDYPDRGSHEVRVSIPETGTAELPEVVVRLEAGGSVRVQVQDASGAPVAGAWVEAVDPGRRGVASVLAPAVETDAEGSVLLHPLPDGALEVRRSDRLDSSASAAVRKGEVTQVVLREAGARVHGRVLVGGRPAMARVRLLAPGFRSPLGDFAETYAIDGVPPGEWSLQVQLQEQGADGRVLPRTEQDSVDVPEGAEDVPHDILLEPTDTSDDATIYGRVQDADSGEALDEWLVTARPVGGGRAIGALARDGAFEITVPEDGTYRLTARAAGPATSGRWTQAGPLEVEVAGGALLSDPPVLLARRRIGVEVTVTGWGGEPVEGAACSLLRAAENLMPSGLRLTRTPTFTDALGRAEVTADEPGPHDLLVVASGRALAWIPRVDPGQVDELPVVLPRTGSIVVEGAETVQLHEGVTGTGWFLRVGPNSDLFGLATVGDGRLVIHGLMPGEWTVVTGRSRATVALAPGATELVTVTDDDG